MRIDEIIEDLNWTKDTYLRSKGSSKEAVEEAIELLSNMPLTNLDAEYKGINGYKGKMYGESSLAIYNSNGKMIFHTGFRTPNTFEELKEHVDGFDEFLKMFTERK